MRIVIELTDDQVTHVRSVARKARRNGDDDVTAQDIKADMEVACRAAIKDVTWEWELRALNQKANVDRRDARQALDDLFPEPEPDAPDDV